MIYIALLTLVVMATSVASAGYGAVCSQGTDCVTSLGDGGTCLTNKTCGCQNEFIYDSSARRCLYKIGTLGAMCNSTIQKCYLEGDGNNQHVICSGGVCRCDSHTTSSGNRCIADAYGDVCSRGTDCVTSLGDGGTCLTNKTCGCQNEFIYDSSVRRCLYKIGTLGETCDYTRQKCYLEKDGDNQHVICSGGVCQCDRQSEPSGNRCKSSASTATVSAIVLLVAVALGFKTDFL